MNFMLLFSKSGFRPQGAGTLMWVLVMVTDAVNVTARPFKVVTTALGGGPPPVVENVIAASANKVPTIVAPVPIVAPAGTYQNTFLAWAPFISRTWTGVAGVAGPVT